jgi:hypothetical protein
MKHYGFQRQIVAHIAKLEKQKNQAYSERDRMVAAISAVYPSHLQRHPEEDAEWEDDWRWIVVVKLPTGQATWHIHNSELKWFDHLDRVQVTPWDGHTVEEKYARLHAATIGEGRGMRWRSRKPSPKSRN